MMIAGAMSALLAALLAACTTPVAELPTIPILTDTRQPAAPTAAPSPSRTPAPTPTPTPTVHGSLAYAKDGGIWVWSSGTEHQVTAGPGDMMPDWSPSGDLLAFARKGHSFADIYTVAPDGTEPRQLTHMKANAREGTQVYAANSSWAFRPRWSPDGRQIAYLTDLYTADLALWMMNPDGKQPRQVSRRFDGNGGLESPSWEPDGKQLVATYYTGTDGQVWLFTLASGQWKQVTKSEGGALDPVFSPDGAYIAYVARENGKHDLWLAHADGSGAVPLTQLGTVRGPAFSPDGHFLAYVAAKDGTFNVWVSELILPANGGAPALGRTTQITNTGGVDPLSGVVWHEDGLPDANGKSPTP